MRFYQRGVIIVANRRIDFAIQKDFRISRSSSNACWFNHSGLKTLAVVLLSDIVHTADLLQDDSFLPRTWLRRTAPGFDYLPNLVSCACIQTLRTRSDDYVSLHVFAYPNRVSHRPPMASG